MSSTLTCIPPAPAVPMVDPITGALSPIWYHFFLGLYDRTGGPIGTTPGTPGGGVGNVQSNAGGGTFAGLTNAQLTARIVTFGPALSGAVPPSGGGTVNFLCADGSFVAPVAALGGAAGGDLSGTYPNPGVSHVNGVAYPAAPATNRVPVVTGSNVITYEVVPVLAGGTGVTTATGSGANVQATNPTLAGATVDGNGALALTTQVSGAAAALGTLANAPSAGNPAFWLQVQINGVTRFIPAW